jgi:hypothetical protein
VRADADERERRVGRPVAVGAGAALRLERDDRVLPRQPLLRSAGADVRVGVVHAPRVGGEHVRRAVAFGLGHGGAEALPFLGEEPADAAVEPVDLGAPRHRHGDEHDLRHALRMALGVRERERRAPRAAVEQPPLDAEVLAQALHVGDEVVGRVDRHVGRRVARVRRAATAAALVEEDRPVAGGVERATLVLRAAGSRPAVHDERRLAVRVAARLPVHEVAVAHVEHPVVVGLDRRMHRHRRSSLTYGSPPSARSHRRSGVPRPGRCG